MIQHTQSFLTEGERDRAIQRYLRDYHPCGYGTTFERHTTPDNRFAVTFTRYRSCD